MARQKPSAHPYRTGAAALLMATSLIALAACSKGKSAEEYLQSAQQARGKGNLPAAIIDLRNALQKDPKNIPARVLLAETYIDMSNGLEASGELAHAAQDGADPAVLQVPIAEADVIQGHAQKVLAETDPPANASAATKASLMSLRARAYMTLGRVDDANAAAGAGLADDPHSVDVLSAMVQIALAQHDLPAARARLTEAQKQSPDDMKLVALEGAIAFASGDPEASQKAYQRIVDARPWNVVARLGLARAQIAGNKYSDANTTLAVVLKSLPNEPNANYLRSLSAYREKDYNAALSYSEHALASIKDFPPALLIAGGASYALQHYEQANSYLNRYIFDVPQSLPARKMLAAVQMRLGHPGDAVKTLSPAAADADSDPQLLGLIGTAAARSGDLTSANRYLGEAVEKEPNNAALRAEFGAAQISAGQTQAGIDELQKAVAQDPNATGPEQALIVAYVRDKDYDKALGVAEQAQKNRPTDPMGWNYAGIIQALKGDDQAAQDAFNKAHELRPNDPMALRNLAALAIKQGKPDVANGYYEEILRNNPKDSAAYIGIAEIEANAGKMADTEATMRKAIEQNPDDVASHIVLARLLLIEGKGQDALAVLEPLLAKNPRLPALLETIGRAQLTTGKVDAALGTFRTWVAAQPESGPAHRNLAEAYVASNDINSALSEASQAARLAPKDRATKVTLAGMLYANGKYADARSVIDELQKQNPEDADVAEESGLVALAQNRTQDAIVDFQHALALRDNGLFRSRLAQAQERAGHLEEAEKTLQPWLEAHPDDVAIRLGLIEIDLATNNLDDALIQANKAVELAPREPVTKIALARVLMAKRDYDGAHKLVDGLSKDRPKDPDIAELAASIAVAQNRFTDAIAAYQNSLTLRDNDVVRVRLAQAEASAGDTGAAEKMLQSAVDLHPDDITLRLGLGEFYLTADRMKDAQTQYAEILRQAPDNVIAANNLAWVLSRLNQPKEALKYARIAQKMAPNAPSVLDTLGLVLLQNENSLEAVDSLRRAVEGAPRDPDIQFHLAQALVSAGHKDEARTILHDLLSNTAPFKDKNSAQKLLNDIQS